MSAFNAFFAQLTGGAPVADAAQSSLAVNATGAGSAGGGGGAELGRRGNVTAIDGSGGSIGVVCEGSGGGSGGNSGSGGGGAEFFGVPLKGVAASYEPGGDRGRFGNPQCESVANLPEASRRRGLLDQGALVAANASFLCYSVKNSIRVIHRSTGARALIKLTGGRARGSPQDMSLLSIGESPQKDSALLACSTSEGDVVVWELAVRAPGVSISGSSASSGALEVATPVFLCVTGGRAQSVAWQPSRGRFLAVICGSVVVVCNVTSLNASAAARAVAGEVPTIDLGDSDDELLPGAVCRGHYKQVADASFSSNGAVLATAGTDGTVRLWETRVALLEAKPMPKSISLKTCFRAATEGSKLSRVLVMEVESGGGGGVKGPCLAVITGDEGNRLLKVWPVSSMGSSSGRGVSGTALTPTPGSPDGSINTVMSSGIHSCQIISLPGSAALCLEADPAGKFVFAADTGEGLLYALHLAGGGNHGVPRMDYLRPYMLAHPVQSFTVLEQAPEPIYGYDEGPLSSDGERILQLICVQTKPVQVYRITAREALPPPGLRALSRVHAASISAASTSYRDLHGDVDSQVEADSVDDTDSNDDVDVDGGGGGRVGSNLKGNVTNANLINSGDEADDAAAAVAMAAAERIFGEDEEDMEVLASDEPISNISNSISSTNSSSGSSTSSLAVGKERCGVSHIGGPGVAKREKKVDVTDEHLGATAAGGGSIMMPTSSLTAISMASETTATISESPGDGARAVVDSGDGGAGDGDGGGGSGGTVRTEMKSRDEGVAGMRGLNSAGAGADDRGSSRSSQQCTTPEGWEGAAEHDWDQDGSSSNGFDHIGNIGNIGGCRSSAGGPGGGGVMNVNEHATAAAACATSAPMASIADSLSETSSGGGGTGEGASAPSTLASSSYSRRRQTAAAPAAAASASPNTATIPSTTNTPASIAKATPPPVPARPARGWQQAVAAGGSNSPVLSSALPPPPATVAASNSKAIQEFSRYFSPHERRKFRGPSSAPSITSTGGIGGSASDVGEASGMSFRPSSGSGMMGTAAGEEGENLLLMVDADRDPSSEEQSVSVSVCEVRQEVGATTNESAAFDSADGGVSAGGGGGGLQATGGGVFSSSGEESTDASYQGGGEGGGGDGSGGVGAGEPSSSGISRLSAHGDASGGSAAVAITAAAAMQYQLGREADNSAGASPIVSRQHHHSSSASPGSLQATAPVAAAGADTSSSTQNQHQLQHQQHKQQQQQSPVVGTGAMVAPLSPTAVGEASRDQGAASRVYSRPLPGVTVDQSATLALRSLLMGGPGSGPGIGCSVKGNSVGGGGEGAAGGSGVGETGSSSFWLSNVMRASGDGIPSALDAGGEAAVGRARSDAEGAGAGIARPMPPMPPSLKVPSEALSSAYSPPRRLSANTAAAPVSVPASSSPPPSPSLSRPLSLPSKPSTSTSNSNVGGVTGAGTGGSSLPPVAPLAPIGNRGTPPGSSSSSARQKPMPMSMPKAMPFASTASSSGSGLATAVKVLSGQQQHQQPQHPRRRMEEAAPVGVGSGGVMVSGTAEDGDGSGPVRVEVAETSVEDLVTAVAARVTAEMAGSMSELRASLQHTVAASCRQIVAEARGGSMAEEERNALLGDITASVDRTMRRGMAETVANPLAKLVVSTARQMVDPLQASMSSLQGSLSTLHGQQPRHVQALAAAAANGAQAGIQAVAQSQASTLATTAARAQAGIVRREVLECRDELSRSVAEGVKEPVGIAFRESFEGQLIPRIQTAVQRMFEQINETLTRGLQASPLVNNRAADVADDVSHVRMRVDGLEANMRDLAGALTTIGEKVDRLADLTLEMQRVSTATAEAIVAQGEAQAQATQAAQAEAAAQSARSSVARAAEPAPVAVDPREELHHLLLAGRLEDAMNRALSASDLPLVMWLCGRLDPATTPAALPQHILVCLLQQLSASNLLDDTAAKLQWLQNCALAVDPSEPKIRTHLPLVLGQLKSALLSATPTIAARGGPDVNMVRLTTHVVNSLGLTSSTMPSAASNTSGPGSGAAAGGGGGGIGGSGGSGGMGGQ